MGLCLLTRLSWGADTGICWSIAVWEVVGDIVIPHPVSSCRCAHQSCHVWGHASIDIHLLLVLPLLLDDIPQFTELVVCFGLEVAVFFREEYKLPVDVSLVLDRADGFFNPGIKALQLQLVGLGLIFCLCDSFPWPS